MVFIQSEVHVSAVVTKRYQCTQKDVQKIVGISLSIASSCVRYSQKNRQAVEEERYPGEIELQNKGSNKYWKFT